MNNSCSKRAWRSISVTNLKMYAKFPLNRFHLKAICRGIVHCLKSWIAAYTVARSAPFLWKGRPWRRKLGIKYEHIPVAFGSCSRNIICSSSGMPPRARVASEFRQHLPISIMQVNSPSRELYRGRLKGFSQVA